jgi:hypothetical protein
MKQLNNKVLIIILVVLASAFILTRLFRSPGRNSNLDSEALTIDTAGVDHVKLYPAIENRKEINLTKEGHAWKVSSGQVTASANKELVRLMLTRLASLKPERIVTRKQEKWHDYEVGDSTGSEVIILSGGKETDKIRIGKEQMDLTFVRKSNDDEVYGVAGMIASSFNKKFNDWRDQTFLKVDVTKINRVTFTYPADSGFVLKKNGKNWMVNDVTADSAKVASFINRLRSRDISNFEDNFSKNENPDVTVSIEAGSAPVLIKGWRSSPTGWVLTSSLQPDTFFLDEQGDVAQELFVGRSELMK